MGSRLAGNLEEGKNNAINGFLSQNKKIAIPLKRRNTQRICYTILFFIRIFDA